MLKRKREEIKRYGGTKSAVAQASYMTYYCEIKEDTPLSIASFIASLHPMFVVEIKLGDEKMAIAHRGRLVACISPVWKKEIKHYLKAARRHFRRRSEPPNSEEISAYLSARYKRRAAAWKAMAGLQENGETE